MRYDSRSHSAQSAAVACSMAHMFGGNWAGPWTLQSISTDRNCQVSSFFSPFFLCEILYCLHVIECFDWLCFLGGYVIDQYLHSYIGVVCAPTPQKFSPQPNPSDSHTEASNNVVPITVLSNNLLQTILTAICERDPKLKSPDIEDATQLAWILASNRYLIKHQIKVWTCAQQNLIHFLRLFQQNTKSGIFSCIREQGSIWIAEIEIEAKRRCSVAYRSHFGSSWCMKREETSIFFLSY